MLRGLDRGPHARAAAPDHEHVRGPNPVFHHLEEDWGQSMIKNGEGDGEGPMRYLMKFGGTSVADGRSIGQVVEIVGAHRRAGHEVAVVVSAMRGVTDGLIACAEGMASAADPDPAPFLEAVRERQARALAEVAPDHADAALAAIDERLVALANILQAVHALRELTPRSRDYIISFGERFSAVVVAAALRQQGVAAEPLDGCAAGILTDDCHGEAMALPESGSADPRAGRPAPRGPGAGDHGLHGLHARRVRSPRSGGPARTTRPPCSRPGSTRTSAGSGPTSTA